MRSLDVRVDDWLSRLLDDVDEHAAALRGAAPADTIGGDRTDATAIPVPVARARDEAAVATLRLDGSPITEVPAPLSSVAPGTGTGPARGGWLEVLRSGTQQLTSVPDEVLLAVEHRGARTGLDADDLATALRTDLVVALTELHARVTNGLLHPSIAGTPRTSAQAVHDASRGRVLFFPVDLASLQPRMAALADWVADSDVHPVVRSGVLHHQLLDLHPFEAANGRLARIAARLLLAAEGIDPLRVSQPEAALLVDPIGYLDEVARSRRLGTPTAFVTRWAEALDDALLATRRAGAGLDVTPLDEHDTVVSPATAAFLADRGTPFTVVDHRDEVGLDERADAALEAARRAGLARRLPASRGLRWVATT